MVIWLNDSTGSLGVEDGIVRAEDVEQLLTLQDCRRVLSEQQEQLLQAAHEQARMVLAQAHQEATVLLETSRRDAEVAVRRGYEEGHHKAMLEWQARQIGHAIDKGQALRALHEKLAGIVTGAVERIVQTESREALYQRALDSVRGLTRGATSLALRVSPADYEDARNALASLPEPHGVSVQVAADAALPPGSCVFESDLGMVDASLHTQLNGLRSAMDRAVRAAVADLDDTLPEGNEHAYGQGGQALGAFADEDLHADEDLDYDDNTDEELTHG